MILIKNAKYRIRVYQENDRNCPFKEWLTNLDKTMRLRISARIARFEDGHFGDCKIMGDGIHEARFFIGPGYRIYFAVIEDQIILILAGGDKSSQQKDILKAKKYFAVFLKEIKNANKKS